MIDEVIEKTGLPKIGRGMIFFESVQLALLFQIPIRSYGQLFSEKNGDVCIFSDRFLPYFRTNL